MRTKSAVLSDAKTLKSTSSLISSPFFLSIPLSTVTPAVYGLHHMIIYIFAYFKERNVEPRQYFQQTIQEVPVPLREVQEVTVPLREDLLQQADIKTY